LMNDEKLLMIRIIVCVKLLWLKSDDNMIHKYYAKP